jgi:hypothetical protein
VKKTITVVTGDGLNGRIRTQAEFVGLGAIPLNVDAMPFILPNGRIRLSLGLATIFRCRHQAQWEATPTTVC